MKKLIPFLFLAAGSLVPYAGVAQFATQSIPMAYQTALLDVATDPLDNVLVTGDLRSPFAVAAKYAPNGAVLWTGNTITSSYGNITGFNIASDQAGNVYVAGRLFFYSPTDSAQLAGGPVWVSGPAGPIYNNNTGAIFVAKYSPTGNLLWANTYSSPNGENSTAMTCTAGGDVILAGHKNSGILSFGNNVTLADSGFFVTKISTGGTTLWAKSIPGGAIVDVEADANDNILLGGSFNGIITIDNQTINNNQSSDAFVAQLSAAGALQWLNTSTASTYHYGGATEMSVNASGNVFVTGTYQMGTLSFGNVTLPDPMGMGMFVTCYSPAGTVLWAKQVATVTGNNNHFAPRGFAADNLGNTFITGEFKGEPTFGSIPLGNPTPGGLSAFLARLDPAGNAVWAIAGGDPTNYDVPRTLALGQNDDLYMIGGTNGQGFAMGGITVSVYGSYLLKFNAGNQFNHIAGQVFYDANNDGIFNPGESPAPGTVLQVGSQYFTTESNGWYHAFTGSGSQTVAPASPPPYYTLTPASHAVSFSGFGNADLTRHFALLPIAGMQDLQVSLTNSTPPRPGFNYPLIVNYKNIGTTTLTGSVEVILDSVLTILGSVPPAAGTGGNTLTWNFSNLAPNQNGTIVVHTQVPAGTSLGTAISQSVSVSPIAGDLTPADNSYLLADTVQGSYDPNDKQVSQSWMHPIEVADGKWLEYTIRFQNTGTDTAFTVRVADTLSAMLNKSSIQLLAASHATTWSLEGNGVLEFRFENILLPDSNTNEAASHGFIKYRVRTNTNLMLGDVVENTAHIYFDYNTAIITNTATTTVAIPVGIAHVESNPLHVYPNPNKGTFTVQCSNISAPQVSAGLRNVLGQTVWQQNLVIENGKLQQVISTSGLSKGVYYLQLKTDNGSKVQKVVIE